MNFELIAEIGQSHDGSLGLAHSYIDTLAKTGVNTIKFQTHIADAESSLNEPFRIHFSYEDKTRYDYWKRMEFKYDEWMGLKNHCEELGMEFISSPFSVEAVSLLESLGVTRYKIGSGEVTNFLMLEKIAKTQKPILISSGLSNYNELDEAVKIIEKHHDKISILQCTTAYPTTPDQWGLNTIEKLKNKYQNYKIGFSDHSGDIYASLFAAALGAEIIEFHFVYDKEQFGPDSQSSLTPSKIKRLSLGIEQLKISQQNPIDKNNLEPFKDLKNIFEKSLAVNKNLPDGHIISELDLEAKKPGNMGIPSSSFQEVVGKTLRVKKNKWDCLDFEDLY